MNKRGSYGKWGRGCRRSPAESRGGQAGEAGWCHLCRLHITRHRYLGESGHETLQHSVQWKKQVMKYHVPYYPMFGERKVLHTFEYKQRRRTI